MKIARINLELLRGAMSRGKAKEFAQYHELHYSWVSRHLSGQTKTTLEDLNKFAQFLNRDVTDFIIIEEASP